MSAIPVRRRLSVQVRCVWSRFKAAQHSFPATWHSRSSLGRGRGCPAHNPGRAVRAAMRRRARPRPRLQFFGERRGRGLVGAGLPALRSFASPRGIASQYTDRPTPDGRRNLRLTRPAEVRRQRLPDRGLAAAGHAHQHHDHGFGSRASTAWPPTPSRSIASRCAMATPIRLDPTVQICIKPTLSGGKERGYRIGRRKPTAARCRHDVTETVVAGSRHGP